MLSIFYFIGKLFAHEVKSANAAAYASRPDVRAKYMGEDINTKARKAHEQWEQRKADEYGLTLEQFRMRMDDLDWRFNERLRVQKIIYDRPVNMYTSFERAEKKAELQRALDEIDIKVGLGMGTDRYKKYDSSWTPEMRREDAWRIYQEVQERERQQAEEMGLL